MESKKLTDLQQLQVSIHGIVQGVGFRPAMYHSAQSHQLMGQICNHGDRVELILEGSREKLVSWKQDWESFVPTQAQINQVQYSWQQAFGFDSLEIIASSNTESKFMPIPSDNKTCDQCQKEYLDPKSRFQLYPFIACTNCGPRYSIIESLPYDRKNTTMKKFDFCHNCHDDYSDIHSRRFHAQNFACASCGPNLWLSNSKGTELTRDTREINRKVYLALKQGKILAVKGIGGYQLVCDAANSVAIKRLRVLKKRPHQALAIMVRDESLLKGIDEKTRHQLKHQHNPIVLCPDNYHLPEELAPDNDKLGMFLPTSGIHFTLFGMGVIDKPLDFLVVTSGNVHGSPMCIENEQALQELQDVADFFLMHNRPIARSVDDSVMSHMPMRLSRGYAPLQQDFASTPMLAMGGDLKNTFAFALGKKLFLSPHMGNLFNSDTIEHFKKCLDDMMSFYQFRPDCILVDKHPGYQSHLLGYEMARQLAIPVIPIQHHKAHVASLAYEWQLKQMITIAFDGTGMGDDETLWGGECFYWDQDRNICERLFGLTASLLVGGDWAVKSPGQQLTTRLLEVGTDIPEVDFNLKKLVENKNGVACSAMGRLFDAVAAMLLPQYHDISYEAQAPMGLETLANKHKGKALQLQVKWVNNQICTQSLIKEMYYHFQQGLNTVELAYSFHDWVARVTLAMALKANEFTDIKDIGFTGGVFNNALLVDLIKKHFANTGLACCFHKKYSTGDGSLALGQLVLAKMLLEHQDA
jgi:hydrogenase maturation protein HypF